MNEQDSSSPVRLDSWKAIADYLGRDVATVRRWERLHRLPVRRIAGRGRSVFAYAAEIDQWLGAMAPADVSTIADAPDEPVTLVSRTPSTWRWPLVAGVVLLVSVMFWSIPIGTSEPAPVRAETMKDGIAAFDESGKQLWLYPFSPEDPPQPGPPFADAQVLAGTEPGVLAATSYYQKPADGTTRSGELLWLTLSGALSRSFSFNDDLTVGAQPYGKPWVISDFRIDESGGDRRIAVAARHHHWWPAVVTVLDRQWRRQGTFYNAGWVDQVRWLSPDRLLVSGYTNAHDGGMVAIVDAASIDGQSPAGMDPMHQCSTCGSESAVRYVVLPRSEVNKASGKSLNGAVVQLVGDRVLVRTIEFHRLTESVEVLYEFTHSLELVRASYGDRYWEMHTALEAEGKIGHTRERCPDREGPSGIRAWEKASGWKAIAPSVR